MMAKRSFGKYAQPQIDVLGIVHLNALRNARHNPPGRLGEQKEDRFCSANSHRETPLLVENINHNFQLRWMVLAHH